MPIYPHDEMYIERLVEIDNAVIQELRCIPKTGNSFPNVHAFMRDYFPLIGEIMKSVHDASYKGKFQCKMELILYKMDADGNVTKREKPWLSTTHIYPYGDYGGLMDRFSIQLGKQCAAFSGWTTENVRQLVINRECCESSGKRYGHTCGRFRRKKNKKIDIVQNAKK